MDEDQLVDAYNSDSGEERLDLNDASDDEVGAKLGWI
jgi:casein kinase II subunit beta